MVHLYQQIFILLYCRKIWQGIKFGGLAVYITTAKLKFPTRIYMYTHGDPKLNCQKFKSASILVIVIWGSTAKFNSHQYFRLYGKLWSVENSANCYVYVAIAIVLQ